MIITHCTIYRLFGGFVGIRIGHELRVAELHEWSELLYQDLHPAHMCKP